MKFNSKVIEKCTFVDIKSSTGTDGLLRRYVAVILDNGQTRDVGNFPCTASCQDALAKLQPYTEIEVFLEQDSYKKDFVVTSFKVVEKKV